mgnify:CR=1 FL=1
MAELTVEVDDKGNIGTLPDALQKFLDKQINESFRRGASKVEAEMKDKLADPAEKERLKLLEDENHRYKEEKALAEKNWEEAARLKEERHTKALADRDAIAVTTQAEIARRDVRLRAMLGAEIQAAAVTAGARLESTVELQKLLGADLDLDAMLQPFVKGADGKPVLATDGTPQTIQGYVTQYLADHPHHLQSTRGTSGRAAGGASLRGLPATGADADVERALATVEDQPSGANLAGAIGAMRRRKTA